LRPTFSRADRDHYRAYAAKSPRFFSSEFARHANGWRLKNPVRTFRASTAKGDRLSALIEARPYPVSRAVDLMGQRYPCRVRAARTNLMLFRETKSRRDRDPPVETKPIRGSSANAIRLARIAAAAAIRRAATKAGVPTRAKPTLEDANTPCRERLQFDLCGKAGRGELFSRRQPGAGTCAPANLVREGPQCPGAAGDFRIQLARHRRKSTPT